MKKVICVILMLIMCFALVACDAQSSNTRSNNTQSNETQLNKDPKEEELTAAKSAYASLVKVNEDCEKIMDSIYSAWYFYIYEGDDYLLYDDALSHFCSETGLNESEVDAAVSKKCDDLGVPKDNLYKLSVLSISSVVYVVVSVYTDNGTYSRMKESLDSAKENMKLLTTEYDDYTGYTTLKSYYSECLSYFEFCESPSGSFSQLSTTIDNYESNLRKYRNDLSFVLE